MKKLVTLLLLLAPSVLAQNPTSGGPIPASTYTTPPVLANPTHGTGAPSGTCISGILYTNDSNGNIYSCNAGVWLLGGGGGSSIFPQTVSGATSGGIPCFTSATNEASSAAIAVDNAITGGGAGACAKDSGVPIILPNSGGDTTSLGIGAGALGSQNVNNSLSVAVGDLALAGSTNGGDNVAVGYKAAQFATTAGANTAIGYEAMMGSIGAPETGNVFNTAVGYLTLLNIQAGANENVAVGAQALKGLTTGNQNVAIGAQAGEVITTANWNVAVGEQALLHNITSSFNTALGQSALTHTTGASNTGVGSDAGYCISSSSENVAVGEDSMWDHNAPCLNFITGSQNTSIGTRTMDGGATTATRNSLLGYLSGHALIVGNDNTFLGWKSGFGVTGNSNIIVGEDASNAITSGSGNILLGNALTKVTNTTSNQMDLGDVITATGINAPASSTTTIQGNLTVTGTCVGCAGTGVLWTSAPGWLRYYGDGSDGATALSGTNNSGIIYGTTVTCSALTTSTTAGKLWIYATTSIVLSAGCQLGFGTAGASNGQGDIGGSGGGGGGGAAGGTGGTASKIPDLGAFTSGTSIGGIVGTAGASSGGNAGGGGSAVLAQAQRSYLAVPPYSPGFLVGGSASGAGGSAGGASVRGGGVIILAAPTITIASGVILDASGQPGVCAVANSTGASGGGGGGVIILSTGTLTDNGGTYNVTAGAGGCNENPEVFICVPGTTIRGTTCPGTAPVGVPAFTTGAFAHVSTFSGGNPTAITVDTAGAGYTYTPGCLIVGTGGGANTGSGATCTVTMSALTIGSIAVAGGNGGYGTGTSYTTSGLGSYGVSGWEKSVTVQ